ncbi:MAG: cellulase family glycosylhydrolase [Bacteroidia bacterium]|nr:cellulase family glycosylhydrolase [Bacteroidia bacterium]
MKKYLIVFLLFSGSAILYLSDPFSSKEITVSTSKEHFVSLKNNKFILNGKDFYPVTVNYIVSLQADKKDFWPCPYKGYNKDSNFKYKTKDSCLMQLQADMELIKELGFNTVRLVGVEPLVDKSKAGLITISALTGEGSNTYILLTNDENYKKYFDALDELFNAVNKAGLKVIFLIHFVPEYKTVEDHFIKLATRFNHDTTIMAYDFFNEPLYFDSLERKKEDVYYIVKRWNKIMKKYAPNQLSTIGLSGIREVFEWDPNILDVDFLSIHPYEYEPEQVRNELYWYGKYIKKSWMIGETSIPADNDSVKYDTQKEFAQKTLEQVYNCGGIGYSWWQYKDVGWFSFHANFMGVLNSKGETTTANGHKVHGTPKPVADAFKNYKHGEKGDCKCFDNYYNYSQHKNKSCRIIGRLVDDNDKPIDGGVIIAWNQWWSGSYHTVSKPDGSFELLGDFQFYHWMASASLYTMVRDDITPDKMKKSNGNIPTVNIGKLKLKRLTFIKE